MTTAPDRRVRTPEPTAAPARETVRETVRRLATAQKSAKGAPAYSRFVNRPAGRYLAALAHRAGLTPNAVSAVSAAFSFSGIAVVALAPPAAWSAAVICAALVVGYALDAADGQLARLRGGGTVSGEWLDHMIDAAKISSLHVAVAIAVSRFPGVDERWTLVPLGFTVVAAVAFFAMILNDQLVRRHGGGPAPRSTSALRSLLVLPTDYGLLCVLFALFAVPSAFLAGYTVLFAGSAAYLLLAVVKWFGDMRALDAKGTS